jgi:hypothetical protein
MKLNAITLSWASCLQTRRRGLAGASRFLAPGPTSSPFERVDVLPGEGLFVFIEDSGKNLAPLQMIEASFADSTGVHPLIPKQLPRRSNAGPAPKQFHRRSFFFQNCPQVPFTLNVLFEMEGQRLVFQAEYSGVRVSHLVPWERLG